MVTAYGWQPVHCCRCGCFRILPRTIHWLHRCPQPMNRHPSQPKANQTAAAVVHTVLRLTRESHLSFRKAAPLYSNRPGGFHIWAISGYPQRVLTLLDALLGTDKTEALFLL